MLDAYLIARPVNLDTIYSGQVKLHNLKGGQSQVTDRHSKHT
jgi:hypothetical protein